MPGAKILDKTKSFHVIKDVAPLLEVSHRFLWDACQQKRIPFLRAGRFYRFTTEQVEAMLRDGIPPPKTPRATFRARRKAAGLTRVVKRPAAKQ